jgi:YbbR domain-containing protein
MEAKTKRQYMIIKICCVIASFILWLYIFNVENPMIERSITVPVQITNKDVLNQSKLIAINEKNLSVSLTISGNASDVYSIKPNDFQLESDLNGYLVKSGENRIPVIVKKSPQAIRIVNSENLWVKIILDNLNQKNVGVKLGLSGKVKEGFFALDPIFKTEKVQVSGPTSIVSSINNVIAKYDLNGLSSDLNTRVSLEAEDYLGNILKGVVITPSDIQLTVPIKKIKNVPINVETQGNLGNGGKIKSITPVPAVIDIAGEENVISNIDSINTEPIDLSNLGNNNTIDAKVIIPKNVILVNSNGIIKLNINFDKGIQKQLDVNIQTKNIGNNYNVALSSDKATIIVSGPEDIVNNLNPQNIDCFVDLSSLNEGDHIVNVNVNLPEGLSKVSQNPLSVTATISKKSTGG